MKLFVGKLSFITTEESLSAFFAKFGPLSSCKIITDKLTGSSRGFAFIEIGDVKLGTLAIKELHGQSLDGRTIVVCEAPDESGYVPGGRDTKGKASGRSSKKSEIGFGYKQDS